VATYTLALDYSLTFTCGERVSIGRKGKIEKGRQYHNLNIVS
jgi:hypothetical protein